MLLFDPPLKNAKMLDYSCAYPSAGFTFITKRSSVPPSVHHFYILKRVPGVIE